MAGHERRATIIVVAYNHQRFLADCIHAVERADLPRNRVRIILVDNASTDGTADFVRRELFVGDCKATKGGVPAEFIASPRNLGFAGGNNLAITRALADGDDFVFLLNPDTIAEPGFLREAIAVMETDPKIAVVQSLLLLHPDEGRVNSWGNEIHYLGFGYAGGESAPLPEARAMGKLAVRDITSASGAAMCVRADAFRALGPLAEELFAYHEDLEFSWRARAAGWRVVFAPESVVRHAYEFSRSIKKWYWMERNRFLVMAWHYRAPTLVLIAPALLVMEIGLWLFAFRSGWWREKARAYAYVLDPRRWPTLLKTRRAMQKLRAASDREATHGFTGRILFQRIANPLLALANPVFEAYWRLIRLVMFW